jgi:phosphoribosyl 1,2-cyclic phosphodiesterase
MPAKLTLRFWGVRGSTPTPLPSHLRYGGNTPCLELRTPAGHLFIFDCGTGFRKLGKALEKEFKKKPIKARIFLTHYHWDHIQGIPFFTPLYNPSNQFLFHGFHFPGETLQQALEGQMAGPYFPVDMSVMAAHRHFFEIAEERIGYDDLVISSRWLHHPQGCLGYRLECNGKVLVYATDTEPGDTRGDSNVRRLADGADLLIYDSQYTPEEMAAHKNWGHSNWKEGIAIAHECKVKKLVLFHHDPDRDDKGVDRILRRAGNHFNHVLAAKEGLELSF